MLRACSHTEKERERERVRGRRVRWGRLDAEGLSGCTCPFPGPLSFEAPRPCKSRMQQSTKCERSIQKPLFSPHSQTLDLQYPVLPVLPVPSSKVPSERRGEKHVKGIDVMQLFPCSPSCLSHYPAVRSKQNNHKNSLTWTEKHDEQICTPQCYITSLSPLHLSASLSFFLGHGALCSISGSLTSGKVNSHFFMCLMHKVISGLFHLWDLLPVENQSCH